MTTKYVVIWWSAHMPFAAEFDNEVMAEAAAKVRNALMITITGGEVKVLDWYRRDEAGRPMPAEWRDLVNTIPGPFGARMARRIEHA